MRLLPIRLSSQVRVGGCGLLLMAAASGCGDAKVAGGSVDGPKIYQDACARCHGADGVPTPGMQARAGVKPLTSERVRGMSDEDIFSQINNGSRNRMMPAFQGALSEPQMKALVAHIRQLQAASPDL